MKLKDSKYFVYLRSYRAACYICKPPATSLESNRFLFIDRRRRPLQLLKVKKLRRPKVRNINFMIRSQLFIPPLKKLFSRVKGKNEKVWSRSDLFTNFTTPMKSRYNIFLDGKLFGKFRLVWWGSHHLVDNQ